MLYMVGTVQEAEVLEQLLPDSVYTELVRDMAILECEYGVDRDYRKDGGFSLVAETQSDLQELKKYIDYENYFCEWATCVGKGSGFLSALYLMNDDFAIMVFMPIAVAPDVILSELEE